MTKDIKFNINNRVTVMLTELGASYYNKFWAGREPKQAGDSWSCQMHELMFLFGDHMYLGGKVPFETEIILHIN